MQSDIETYLKFNSECLSGWDITYLKTIFRIFQKENEFEQVLNNCDIYLYKLGTRQEINTLSDKKDILEKSLKLGWINLILRQDTMFLVKIEEIRH